VLQDGALSPYVALGYSFPARIMARAIASSALKFTRLLVRFAMLASCQDKGRPKPQFGTLETRPTQSKSQLGRKRLPGRRLVKVLASGDVRHRLRFPKSDLSGRVKAIGRGRSPSGPNRLTGAVMRNNCKRRMGSTTQWWPCIYVMRMFPNTASCWRLVRALAVESNENWMEANRCLPFGSGGRRAPP